MLTFEYIVRILLLQEYYVPGTLVETSFLIERYKGTYHTTELREILAKLVTTHCPRNIADTNYVFRETIRNHGKSLGSIRLYRSLYIQQMYRMILHQFVQVNV